MTMVRLEPSSKLIKLLLLGGVATALIGVPAAIDGNHLGIAWQTALAKNDGGKGGGGGDRLPRPVATRDEHRADAGASRGCVGARPASRLRSSPGHLAPFRKNVYHPTCGSPLCR